MNDVCVCVFLCMYVGESLSICVFECICAHALAYCNTPVVSNQIITVFQLKEKTAVSLL